MTENNVSALDYLKMSGWQKFCYKLRLFFRGVPAHVAAFFTVLIPKLFFKACRTVAGWFTTLALVARDGDWKTRTSFGVMGFSQLARKQIARGIALLAFEILFILYISLFGWKYLALFGTLGVTERGSYQSASGITYYTEGDNSLLILLYSILTIFFILAFVYIWYFNVKSAYNAQLKEEAGRRLETAKEDVASLLDEQYHKTLLTVPMVGLAVFTILPIIFMVFIAFTNYDIDHYPPNKLFTWVGWENFLTILGGGISSNSTIFLVTFGGVLLWTVVWAFFATFSNYILGMVVALLINKKGIRFKKLWRTVLIMTIAVPQFISLLLMSQMLGDSGFVNLTLQSWGWTDSAILFLTDGSLAKVTIIVVNIWIGIPYTMLICTGILMNIPEDLYESARIDGAGPFKAYMKITLPYMLHVTTPYLITQFIGNLNNFNVIYLLTGGAPNTSSYMYAGKTDLLITWLYKLVMDNQQYGLAAVLSILMFIITAVISLIVYNRSGSVKNEEEFM